MNFESIRQIVESRIFSVEYTTVTGDTLQSIADDNNKTLEDVQRLNPEFSNFSTNPIINFATETDGAFNNTRITGFTEDYLVTGDNAITELRFSNHDNQVIPNGEVVFSGNRVQLRAGDNDSTLSEKVSRWISLINGESTLGFTVKDLGDNTIELVAKDPAVNEIQNGSLTVSSSFSTNSFGATIVYSLESGLVLSLGSTLSFPTFLESRDFTQPSSGNWAVLFIDDSTVVGREFANTNGLRSAGSVRLKLYAPRNAGTRLVRTMADELNAILSYTAGSALSDGSSAGGTLLMKAGSLTRVSDDEDGSLSYNLDYIYDYYTSA